MKKKRKKKATSPSCQPRFPFPNCSRTTLHWSPSLGSIPDVPNGSTVPSCGMKSCLEFASKLFGHEVWHEVPDGANLRCFSRQLTDKIVVHWDTVHVENCLYVHVPQNVSKESFVALLDYAEEVLEVKYVITCIDVDSYDFKELVKSFRFVGFEHILPDNPLICFKSTNNGEAAKPKKFHFMGYEI